MITRFVFSGTGGQGIITGAIVLAEAAIHYEGLEAVQTQSYGAEARGGAARADLIIATDPIKFPKVTQPNVLVCLSQVSFDKYSWIVRPGGFVLIDPHFAHRRNELNARCIEIPMHSSILAAQHSAQNLNLCMLGALTGLIDFVSTESLTEAVRVRFEKRGVASALQAVEIGRSLVHETVDVF
ncbi:MAG: 2-oxoacid:acceptor oxidoreductase family protein [Spirochaetia bacterium]